MYPTIEQIQAAVAEAFDTSVTAMKSRRRDRRSCRPRWVAMWLCRELTLASLPQIGREFGKRDHTTVMHAVAGIEQQMAQHPQLRTFVAALADGLRIRREAA